MATETIRLWEEQVQRLWDILEATERKTGIAAADALATKALSTLTASVKSSGLGDMLTLIDEFVLPTAVPDLESSDGRSLYHTITLETRDGRLYAGRTGGRLMPVKRIERCDKSYRGTQRPHYKLILHAGHLCVPLETFGG